MNIYEENTINFWICAPLVTPIVFLFQLQLLMLLITKLENILIRKHTEHAQESHGKLELLKSELIIIEYSALLNKQLSSYPEYLCIVELKSVVAKFPVMASDTTCYLCMQSIKRRKPFKNKEYQK